MRWFKSTGKVLRSGEEKPEGSIQRVRWGENTLPSPAPTAEVRAINSKAKMALLNTSDKINLVITGAEHGARWPHLLARSL